MAMPSGMESCCQPRAAPTTRMRFPVRGGGTRGGRAAGGVVAVAGGGAEGACARLGPGARSATVHNVAAGIHMLRETRRIGRASS